MKPFIIILLCFLILPSNVLAARGSDQNLDVKHYVNDLISEGYNIVQNPNLSSEQRFRKSVDIIKANLHLDWMAKYTLGRNKRELSDAKLKEFIDVYSKFVVYAYADLSRHYNGEKAVVKMIKPIDDHMFMVNMEIAKMDSQPPIKVDYLIHKLDNVKGNPYRVADVITEGVSILNSQQSEFNSVIVSQGIDALIANLQKKIDHKEARESGKK